MQHLENEIFDTLTDLKENYNVIGLKTELETEVVSIDEIQKLKLFADQLGLDLTVKIGGCEAIKDIIEAKNIGANTIVAPMIESPYAAKKFIQSTKLVFSENERKSINFLINIETKYGFNYLDEILKSDFSKDINGIVVGRTDMTGSLNMDTDDVNNEIILEYANAIAQKTLKYNKELTIGGGISDLSIPFLKKLPIEALNKFETRKVIFDAQKALQNKNIEKGILKAINFEIMWIKNKKNYCAEISKEDNKRIATLETRCKNVQTKSLSRI